MTLKNSLSTLLSGKFLPTFSRTILRDGQLYYLTTLVLNIVVIVVYYLNIPWLSSCTFGIPLFVLINTLAAHVYRNLRFKVCLDQTITTSVLHKNLMGMGVVGNSTTGAGSPLSNTKPNDRDPHGRILDITFKRSVTPTTTSTLETGMRRHSMGNFGSEVGRLDLEKQGGI